jgi:glucose-1-phosphate thymidylyltransferase
VENSNISNSIIQTNCKIENAVISNSMIGNFAVYSRDAEDLSLGDYSTRN